MIFNILLRSHRLRATFSGMRLSYDKMRQSIARLEKTSRNIVTFSRQGDLARRIISSIIASEMIFTGAHFGGVIFKMGKINNERWRDASDGSHRAGGDENAAARARATARHYSNRNADDLFSVVLAPEASLWRWI